MPWIADPFLRIMTRFGVVGGAVSLAVGLPLGFFADASYYGIAAGGGLVGFGIVGFLVLVDRVDR